MKMEIKKAESKEEIEKCLEIRRKVFIEEKGVPSEIEIDFLDENGSECEHFYAEENGKTVAAFRCVTNENNEVKLQRFCVDSKERGKGIGKQLCQFVFDYYKKKNATKVYAHAKFEALPFYEKCGFKAVSNVFKEANVDHVEIEKKL